MAEPLRREGGRRRVWEDRETGRWAELRPRGAVKKEYFIS